MAKAGFVISLVSLVVAAAALGVVVAGVIFKKMNYFSAD